MDLPSKEEIWFKRQTEPAVLQESTITKTLYKALIKKCETAWNGDEEAEKETLEEEAEDENENVNYKFASEWTVHGPKHFIIRSWFRRCLWAIVWLAMVGYSINSCYNVFKEYYAYPTKTSIGLEEENSLEFPAVTVCSLASLTPENGTQWFIDHKLWRTFLYVEEMYGNSSCPDDYPIPDSNTTLAQFKDQCLAMNAANMSEDMFSLCYIINGLSSLNEVPTTGSRRKRHTPLDDIVEELRQQKQNMENPNLPPLKRTRRASNYANPSAEDRKFLRMNCDKVYQLYILRQNIIDDTPLPNDFQYGNMSKCPPGYENPKTKYVEDIVCTSTGVFQDPYGFYNRDLYDCKTTFGMTHNGTKYVCSSCCDYDIECLTEIDFIQENSSSSYSDMNVKSLINKIIKSAFKDGLDLMNDFSPSYQDLLSATVPPESVISTCSFDQGFCSVKDFLVWPNYLYGSCYTFNAGVVENGTLSYKSKNHRNTSSYGPKNGLRIGMNIFPDTTLALLTPEFGARVVFHMPGTIPFPEEEGFTIPPGTSNSISIKPMKISRQPQPWGKCGSKDLDSTFSYTKRLCEKQCIEKEYMNACKCFPGIGPAYANIPKNNLPRCNLEMDSVRLCMNTVSYNYSFGTFSCDCPISCSEWSYSADFSTAANDPTYYAIINGIKQVTPGKDNCANKTDGTVRLHVYLAKLAYESVTATPSYSFDSLLSNLGGNFGLFIGVTVISIFELMEFFIDAVIFCYRKSSPPPPTKKNKHTSILLMVERLFSAQGVDTMNSKED